MLLNRLNLRRGRLQQELSRLRGRLGEVPALKSAAPKVERPRRSFLEAEQIAAVLRAADLIEAERRGLTWESVDVIRSSSRSAVSLARELGVSDTLIGKVRRGELWNGAPAPRNRNDVPRRVVIGTLILGGLRVSELCGLDGPHLDIAGGRVRVPRSATKSDAGERDIPIVPALRRSLTEHRTEYPSGQGEPAFPTRNGTRQNPDNVRARILGPIRERATWVHARRGSRDLQRRGASRRSRRKSLNSRTRPQGPPSVRGPRRLVPVPGTIRNRAVKTAATAAHRGHKPQSEGRLGT